jgi:hypothetical protein
VRRFTHISLALAALVAYLARGDTLRAKDGVDQPKRLTDLFREVDDRHGAKQPKPPAGDMDRRAQSHDDKLMEQSLPKSGLVNAPPDSSAPANVDCSDGKLTDPRNAAARQLRNELRNLKRRMEAVKRLRDLAKKIGNDKLLEAADRLEQRALEHFHKRMEELNEFKRRHGLPDIKHHVAH